MTDLGLFRDAFSTALIIVCRKRYDALFMNFTSERILKKAIVAYFEIIKIPKLYQPNSKLQYHSGKGTTEVQFKRWNIRKKGSPDLL